MAQSAAQLESRAIQAAEAALESQDFVSPIDVLVGMGRLAASNVEAWRKGRLAYLEEMMQGRPEQFGQILEIFRGWALAKGLQPSEIRYVRDSRGGPVDLQFTAGGDPEMERAYRTHYISPAVGETKRRKLEEKSSRAADPVVFDNLRNSKCGECGVEIGKGEFLYMEGGQPLCLACGGFGNLEFLPAGDTAMTRRARKYSGRSAVVVRFSRSRKRYERQGILVEAEALEKAERECAEDAGERALDRERGAAARKKQDKELTARMADRIRQLFPGCPPEEAVAVAQYTAERGSGRIGRSAAGRALDDHALRLAVEAAIRHRHTDYDRLLAGGTEREAARGRVRGRQEEVLERWEAG